MAQTKAHSQWATHVGVTQYNAHPHFSSSLVEVAHNGIIEKYVTLRKELGEKGYTFSSNTDTETTVHVVHDMLNDGKSLLKAVQSAVSYFAGAYRVVLVDKGDFDTMVFASSGSPLVIEQSMGENFIASDQ
ncbi:MAG: hypothetical protein Altm2KO_20270 [Alteromonas macleodii]|jgi:glucosamine--fructose-6-phosphate aminotransferase (isomerizing)|nr:glutamine amidotransferase-like protein [Alteromonas macleodii]VTP57470.1 glutamine amidotransferase-like protein [Alteromonas macleodii]|tara:strand:- start:736 stop:1128 length:393 start_codon:yes stop_codon:yes gene_type:complete